MGIGGWICKWDFVVLIELGDSVVFEEIVELEIEWLFYIEFFY